MLRRFGPLNRMSQEAIEAMMARAKAWAHRKSNGGVSGGSLPQQMLNGLLMFSAFCG